MFRRNQFVDRQRGLMMQKNNTQQEEQHKKASSNLGHKNTKPTYINYNSATCYEPLSKA